GRLRVCDPASGGRAWAPQIVEQFAAPARRRPGAPREGTPPLGLAGAAPAPGGDLPPAPPPPPPGDPPSPSPRLPTPAAAAPHHAYFLWTSRPDAGLFAHAAAGDLHQPDVLRAEVARMLADPKAAAIVDTFAGQWLQTLDMPQASPNPTLFPRVTGSLKQAMH